MSSPPPPAPLLKMKVVVFPSLAVIRLMLGFGACLMWTAILKAGGWDVSSIFISVNGQRFKEFSCPIQAKFCEKNKKSNQIWRRV